LRIFNLTVHMSLKYFFLFLLLCFNGVGSDGNSEGFLDIASRFVYQADLLQHNRYYRKVIHVSREDSEDGLKLKLRVVETACSTELALFIGYVYSNGCPDSHVYSSIKCLLTLDDNRTNVVLECNFLLVERILGQ
ncbi:hypothetical protein T11_5649, partial [Trichinella zimbabwensis]